MTSKKVISMDEMALEYNFIMSEEEYSSLIDEMGELFGLFTSPQGYEDEYILVSTGVGETRLVGKAYFYTDGMEHKVSLKANNLSIEGVALCNHALGYTRTCKDRPL